MTVRLAEAATIELEGVCTVEDAEALLRHLLETPEATVDWRLCEHAHAAVVQVLISARVPLRGPPRSAFLADFLEPAIRAAQAAMAPSK